MQLQLFEPMYLGIAVGALGEHKEYSMQVHILCDKHSYMKIDPLKFYAYVTYNNM